MKKKENLKNLSPEEKDNLILKLQEGIQTFEVDKQNLNKLLQGVLERIKIL